MISILGAVFFVLCTIPTESRKYELVYSMPTVAITEPDQYICSALELADFQERHVESMLTEVKDNVHHVTITACEEPLQYNVWNCRKTQGNNCKGAAVSFGGYDDYTKQKGPYRFPKGLSIRVGRHTPYRYLVVQIHFKEASLDRMTAAAKISLTLTDSRTDRYYQIYALGNSGFIPANAEKGFMSESACKWKYPSVRLFRYYVHTHHRGYHAETFLVRNNTWLLIGSVLTQKKSKTYIDIPGGPLDIQKGDILATRCLFINDQPEPIRFGMGDNNEMCNFEIDFGYRLEDEKFFSRSMLCQTDSPSFKFSNFPGVLDYF